MHSKVTARLVLTGLLLSNLAFAIEALPKKPPVPKDNPMTPAKIELGKQLFHDPRLSGNGSLSCASCHSVMGAGGDGRMTSVGIHGQEGGRNAPTVWNSAYLSAQFWDGRAATLEDQAKGPLINPIEMGMTSHDEVVTRIKKIEGYQTAFAKVFGVPNSQTPKDTVNIDNVAKAIAAYERTLVTPNSPYDKFARGDSHALNPRAKKGFEKFNAFGCVACHQGATFAGPTLPTGQGFYQKFPVYKEGNPYLEKYKFTKDLGRYEVTKKDEDKNTWRVPTLRNVAVTAPYFHNGAVKTLDEAVRVMAKSQLNRTLTDEEAGDLVEFLKSLTGEFPKQEMPRLPDTVGYSM